MYHGGIRLATCILNTVTESHEFIEDYFAAPIKSPAILNRYLFCQRAWAGLQRGRDRFS